MEQQQLIDDLLSFLKNDNAVKETMACLNKKAEIEIRVAQTNSIKVHYDGDKVVVIPEKALAPDFIFDASPEAIAVLIAENNLTPAQLGIKFMKQLISRDIKVSMPSSIFQITRKGYLNIMKVGGMEFIAELKKHNLASIPKITAALAKLRK